MWRVAYDCIFDQHHLRSCITLHSNVKFDSIRGAYEQKILWSTPIDLCSHASSKLRIMQLLMRHSMLSLNSFHMINNVYKCSSLWILTIYDEDYEMYDQGSKLHYLINIESYWGSNGFLFLLTMIYVILSMPCTLLY
jgi:hypothetical protein